MRLCAGFNGRAVVRMRQNVAISRSFRVATRMTKETGVRGSMTTDNGEFSVGGRCVACVEASGEKAGASASIPGVEFV